MFVPLVGTEQAMVYKSVIINYNGYWYEDTGIASCGRPQAVGNF